MNFENENKSWLKISENEYKYHIKQFQNPKQSTLKFYKFIKKKLLTSGTVLDIAAGASAATCLFASKATNTQFTALDINYKLLKIGKEFANKKKLSNIDFKNQDMYKLKSNFEYDGIILLQTLSWLREMKKPLKHIFRLQPNWLALSSLFYEGDITCKIQVNEHKQNTKRFYNIYSMPEVERIADSNNYFIKKILNFNLNFDIKKPKNPDHMMTYTRTLINSNNTKSRLQLSGPLLLPWKFILLEKKIK